MVELNWTEKSLSDLSCIATYISGDSPTYAKIMSRRIRERAQQLKYFPNSGRMVPEFGDPSVRELMCGSYRIIHRIVTPYRVDILTIHHSSRVLQA
jgi:toxin ParE1/3/4